MKIFVIHGDNETASRNRLSILEKEARKKALEIRKIDSAEPTFSENVLSKGLFGESILLVSNAQKLNKKDLQLLFNSPTRDIILFSPGFLPKGILNSLPEGSVVEEYRLPKLIYKFLDSFSPGNSRNTLDLLHRISGETPDELIVHLLARHLRDLYVLKLDGPLDYPDWRVLKLASQAKKYSKVKLSSIINKLAEIDVATKSSKEKLISSLDLLIATELE